MPPPTVRAFVLIYGDAVMSCRDVMLDENVDGTEYTLIKITVVWAPRPEWRCFGDFGYIIRSICIQNAPALKTSDANTERG